MPNVRLTWNGNNQAQREADAAFSRLKPKQTPAQKKKAKKSERRRARRKAFVRPDYATYIQSAAWKAKRKQALLYHGNECKVCKSTLELTVHHKTYTRLGREKMKDLEVLCVGCHGDLHEEYSCRDALSQRFTSIVQSI